MTFRSSTEENWSPRTLTLRVWTSDFCTSGACGGNMENQKWRSELGGTDQPNWAFIKASNDLKYCTLVEFCVWCFFKDGCFFSPEDESGGHGQSLVGLQEAEAQPGLRPGFDDRRDGHHVLSVATETHMQGGHLTRGNPLPRNRTDGRTHGPAAAPSVKIQVRQRNSVHEHPRLPGRAMTDWQRDELQSPLNSPQSPAPLHYCPLSLCLSHQTCDSQSWKCVKPEWEWRDIDSWAYTLTKMLSPNKTGDLCGRSSFNVHHI